jgi:hypothetical protein
MFPMARLGSQNKNRVTTTKPSIKVDKKLNYNF